MRQVWVTAIIAITWVAAIITILQQTVDVFVVFASTLAVTFYYIIFGIQHTKE